MVVASPVVRAAEAPVVTPHPTEATHQAPVETPDDATDRGGTNQNVEVDEDANDAPIPDPAPNPGEADASDDPFEAWEELESIADLRDDLGFGGRDRSRTRPERALPGTSDSDGNRPTSPKNALGQLKVDWVSVSDAMATPVGRYRARIDEVVEDRWVRSDLSVHERATGIQGSVVVVFKVEANGKVHDKAITRSSGHPPLDRMAQDAIPERLPRFPTSLERPELFHRYQFHYRNPIIVDGDRSEGVPPHLPALSLRDRLSARAAPPRSRRPLAPRGCGPARGDPLTHPGAAPRRRAAGPPRASRARPESAANLPAHRRARAPRDPRDPPPEQEPPAEDPEGQVIEIAPPETPEAPDVADYLADVDSRVPEETRVEQTVVNPEVIAPTLSEEQTYEQEDRKELNVEDPSTGATPGSERFDPARDGNLASVVSEWQITNKDGVQDPVPASHMQAALSGAPQNDRLDAKVGEEVAVNAKAFIYAGYINRIKRLVNYYWKQNVDNLPPETRLVKPRYRTVVGVVLTDAGALEQVAVTTTSGSEAMDDCVIRAFHLAGPFPNPPPPAWSTMTTRSGWATWALPCAWAVGPPSSRASILAPASCTRGCSRARGRPPVTPRRSGYVPPMPLLDPTDAAAWRTLRDALGHLGALRVALIVRLQAAAGAPFGDLPAATSPDERDSRAQAGAAILLYRALVARWPDRALALTRDVIIASAMAFLTETVGDVRPHSLAGLQPSARASWVRARLDRFPNVTATVDRAEPDQVAFTVSACRLVALARHAGHPELARLFCAADGRFFAGAGIRLERPTTLAAGDAACHFHLHRERP